MKDQVPEVDLRFAELQRQIDRLTVALQRWQPPEERANVAEARLNQLVERCATTFVETIEQQGEALRALHAEPVQQLREQAANLEETCIAAANLALRGFERAEQRVASLEADLQTRMAYLSRQIDQALVALGGSSGSPARALTSGVSPFPLESVMRIHDEVRRGDATHAANRDVPIDPAGLSTPLGLVSTPRKTTPSSEPSTPRPEPSGPVPPAVTAEEGRRDNARIWRTALLAIGAIVIVVLAWQLQRRVAAQLDRASERMAAAEQRAQEATALASREIASTRDDAQKRIAEARQTARQAEIVGEILAAPDLTRYNLSGAAAAPRAFGHVLWSRSRGLVLSASRLPVPPEGRTYQLWFSTASGPVSIGTFTPDAEGRATLASDEPPAVRQIVSGVSVTMERAGGAATPAGSVILTRVQ